jgi:hypothetical protein
MKHRLTLLIGCLLLLPLTVPCSAKEWRNILPLKTTRAEALQLLGTPLHGSSDEGEYFEIDNQTVTIRWARPDCSGQGLIVDEQLAGADALVYQITVKPKVPLKLSDLGLPSQSDITSSPSKYSGWLSQSINCSGGGEKGAWDNCSILIGQEGFGYATSKAGVIALYYFPTDEEAKAWNQKHQPCSP